MGRVGLPNASVHWPRMRVIPVLPRTALQAILPMGTRISGFTMAMWRSKNGSIMAISSSLGSRFWGGRQGITFAMYRAVSPSLCRSMSMAANILSNSWPARPINGLPIWSSARPGASPIIMTRAVGLPSEKTRLRAPFFKAQYSKVAMAFRRVSRSLHRAAKMRATSCAALSSCGLAGISTMGLMLLFGCVFGIGLFVDSKDCSYLLIGSSPIASSAPS